MCEVPVFYATSEGQTRRIAERIVSVLRTRGFDSEAIDVTSAEAKRIDWNGVRGVLLGASIHAGRHQRSAIAFGRRCVEQLNARPSGFFSVSLSAASARPEELATVTQLAHALPAQIGWQPRRIVCVAGRLAYTQYGFFTRLIMRRIARKEGGPTDTSRDYELTDWKMVVRFAEEMAQEILNAERQTASA
jgi:menaquinone-dependent protoporphyrinogen oxidase